MRTNGSLPGTFNCVDKNTFKVNISGYMYVAQHAQQFGTQVDPVICPNDSVIPLLTAGKLR
jgi:hypothetical protein